VSIRSPDPAETPPVGRLYVLDAMGLAYRAHYAFIARPLVNSRGEQTSTLFGMANVLLKIRHEARPDHWALAWDGPGPTWRHERYPDYKAQRKPTPEALLAQLEPLETLAQALGCPVIEIPGMEADDVMATLAARGARDGLEVVLVTGDKDMLQVVGGSVRVLAPRTRDDYEWVDPDGVRAKWGVGPEHIRDVLALMGDASDNIPGVPGIGEKTAVELMGAFGSLEELYRRLDEVKKPALRGRLEQHRDLAFLSRDLATVRADLDLPLGWDDLRVAPIRRDALLEFARRWEIRRLESVARTEGVADGEAGAPAPARPPERRGTVSETPAEGVRLDARDSVPAPAAPPARPPEPAAPRAAGAPAPPARAPAGPLAGTPTIARSTAPLPATLGDPQGTLDLWSTGGGGEVAPSLDRLVERLHAVRARAPHGLALLPVLDTDAPRTTRVVGLGLAARDGTAAYLPIAHAGGPNLPAERVREWLALALGDASVEKTAHDLKALHHALATLGLPLAGGAFDLHLGSFVCDPARDHSLPALARDVLGVALAPLEPPVARGRPRGTRASLDVGSAVALAERAAACHFPLAEALRAQIEAREQWALYRDLEHPLIEVLVAMERAGVALDAAVLRAQSASAAERIASLEERLQGLAGEPVNLQSGPQLARVLFEVLGLKPTKKTKTGWSTDAEVLDSLAAEHEFPRLLLEYRLLTKLRSTYLEALPEQVDRADGRVHTTFEQTGAATGRLSSSDPNLQNIPMRTPEGRQIRRAFVAPPGRVLVGADYSQIELRVMAHLSGDPGLTEAFAAGEDVHAATARRIFRVTGEPDPALRARAKIVNFGVMYGMGARSLAQQMGIPLDEAQDFIRGYFDAYARVREYLDDTLAEARRTGWVQTLLGRRRWLPALRSANGLERSNAERAAINTPIQGSAADLVKLAMIRSHRALMARGSSARLLLQVHDELLFECDAAEVAEVATRVRAEMEGCFTLRVPLTVSVGSGATWLDVHA
jgi:DNA polymerase-1